MPYEYVFEMHSSRVPIVFIVALVLAIAITIWLFKDTPTYTGKSRIKHKLPTWIFFMLVCCVFAYAGVSMIIEDSGLKKYGVQTIGTLTSKEWHTGKSQGWKFKYTYTIKGEIREGSDAYGINDDERKNAHKGAHFMVLYDSTRPSHSFMDLHEPVRCDTCNNQ